VLLRDVEGLSQQETAEALGLTVVNVKSRLHRARLFLRKRLEARLAVSGRSVRRPTSLRTLLIAVMAVAAGGDASRAAAPPPPPRRDGTAISLAK